MIKAILLAVLFVVCALTEDAEIEPLASASRNQEYFGSEAHRGKTDKDKDLELTEAENRIIQDFFSPDYYEPNIILDYRYLKTGGRGYARSDGGKILILPKRNHMPPPENNYDTLLEYLRLKHLEYISKEYTPKSRLRENYAEMDDGISREYDGEYISGGNENIRENMGGYMGGNMRENVGDNMRVNMRGNVEGNLNENMGENMGRNMGGNVRGNMRGNMGGNIGGNVGGNMRQNRREYVRNILDDRRESGYRNEKYGHDLEDKYSSDAEYGSALYNH